MKVLFKLAELQLAELELTELELAEIDLTELYLEILGTVFSLEALLEIMNQKVKPSPSVQNSWLCPAFLGVVEAYLLFA